MKRKKNQKKEEEKNRKSKKRKNKRQNKKLVQEPSRWFPKPVRTGWERSRRFAKPELPRTLHMGWPKIAR